MRLNASGVSKYGEWPATGTSWKVAPGMVAGDLAQHRRCEQAIVRAADQQRGDRPAGQAPRVGHHLVQRDAGEHAGRVERRRAGRRGSRAPGRASKMSAASAGCGSFHAGATSSAAALAVAMARQRGAARAGVRMPAGRAGEDQRRDALAAARARTAGRSSRPSTGRPARSARCRRRRAPPRDRRRSGAPARVPPRRPSGRSRDGRR